MNGEDATDVRSVRYWVRHFEGGEMDTGVRHLSAVAKSLARSAHSITCKTRKMCVDNEGNFVANNLHFVKDVPIMAVNFPIIVFLV